MKQFLILLAGILLLGSNSFLFAQKKTQSKIGKAKTQIDYRIDNMEYWLKMAEKGLIPFNQPIPVAPAEYKGTMIKSPDGTDIADSPDVPVSNATDLTESENSVFVDPNNNQYLLNSNNSTGWNGSTYTTLYGANYFQSANGGLTWGGSYEGAGGTNSGDPATAIGLNGRQFVNFIDDPGGQGIAYSDDGVNWSTSTIGPNPGSLADKNHMWIDNSPGSPYEGNLYCAWTDFGGSYDYEVVFSRSTDNGVSWSTRFPISGTISTFDHGVNLQTGPNGEVYAIWATYPSSGLTENGIGFAKSTDGGVTFGTPVKIISNTQGIRAIGVQKNHRVNSFPVAAVDISSGPYSGNIYAVWSNYGDPNNGNSGSNISVYMIRSTDGGSSWTSPIRVNQGPMTDGKEAYSPWITCDPETGNLGVVFYDDRNTASTACETWVAYSVDAGDNWLDFRVSDVSFTPSPIPGLASGYMGDYLGITSRGNKFYPCWTDTRNSLYMTYVSPFELGLNASFTVDNTLICTGSSVNFTDLSSGPPTSWSWSFPGGTPSTYNGQNPPAITYNSPGTYDVSLTVDDGSGNDTETKTGFITVQNVIADFSGSPVNVVVGNTVTFTDMSSCAPTSWSWTFPGGSPSNYSGQNPPPIQYDSEGTYDVTLMVSNGNGSGNDTEIKTGYISVIPPEFNMQNGTVTTCMGNFYDPGGPSGGYSNNEDYVMTFYAASAGAQIEFLFSLFDVEDEPSCGYDYLNIYNGENTSAPLIGTYCGTNSPGLVSSSNAAGAITFEWHSDVYVTGPGWQASISCSTNPPMADFMASNTTPVPGETVVFSDMSTGGPTSWNWTITPATYSFVNGTNANSQNPEVQFNDLGFHSVSLDVTNPYGSGSETKNNYINVINCVYCASSSNNGSEEWIANVTFNTINNTTAGSDGYMDYTTISTDVMPGETHNISVSCGSIGSWSENYWVYFDWNQDCDFDDTGESYDLGQTTGPGTLNTDITVPLGAVTGTVRMRVVIKYNSDPVTCEIFSYGEVEDYTVVVNPEFRELDLKVFLEGPFNGTDMDAGLGAHIPLSQPFNQAPWYYNGSESVASIPNGNILDWVLIDARDATSPASATGATSVEKHAAFIKTDGSIVDLDGSSNLPLNAAIGQNLYIVIWQRNHIGIIANNALVPSGGIYSYDFSSGMNQVFGGINGHKELAPGIWGMFSGDSDRDGIIGNGDMSPTWEDNAGNEGYDFSDLNLDSQTNNIDKDEFWVPNIGEGTQVPN